MESEMSEIPLSVLSKKAETPIERVSIKPYDWRVYQHA
jgi:hypothetical protein